MKFFALFFSFYLLALSIVPCNDAFSATEKNFDTTTISANHEHSGETTDFCSPFCICHCCNSPVISKFRASFQVSPGSMQFTQLKHPIWELIFISNFSGNIWHPPQLTV